MRITTKFIGSSAVLIGLTSVLSGTSYMLNKRAVQSLNSSYNQAQKTITTVVHLERSLQDQITTLNRLSVLDQQMNQNTQEWVSFQRSRAEVFNTLQTLEAVLPAEDRLSQLKLQSIRQRHGYLDDIAARIRTQIITAEQAEGIVRSLLIFEDNVDAYLNNLIKTAEAQVDSYSQQQQTFHRRLFWTETLSTAFIPLMLIAQFYYLLRPVIRSIHRLEAGANQIGREHQTDSEDNAALSLDKIQLNTGDELQSLAESFNYMGDRLTRLYRELEQRVSERTASLHQANQTLLMEVGDRIEAEASLTAALEELKRTQIQLLQTEKMSSLGQLVAGVAHEINNPVSFIEGNLEPAQDYLDSLLSLLRQYEAECPEASKELLTAIEDADIDFIREDFPRLLQSMQTGADRITKIVQSLRTFSHLDESETKATNIHDDLDSVLLLVSSQINGTGQSALPEPITVVRNYGDLPRVYCYPSQMNQVFMGLITNAIEAIVSRFEQAAFSQAIAGAPDTDRSITDRSISERAINSNPKSVLTLTTEAFPSFVRIQITDSGIGMSETVKQHIFDPFFTTKPVGRGTGLGLSMSYQIIVSNHQGRLTCESAPNQGTTFTIEIPLTLKQQSPPARAQDEYPAVFSTVA